MLQSQNEHSDQQLDLVVVGFTGEMRALKLQARSLRLFAAKGMFSRILYVCNDLCFRPFKRFIETQVKSELGELASKAEVINYRQLTGKAVKKTGWRSQQAMKILAANIVSAPQYLILDSKNYFIRPFNRRTFIADDGKLCVHSVPINPLFRKHFNNACAYFDIKAADNIEVAHPTTTPFLMKTAIAKSLMADVKAREGASFFDFFMRDTALNEFYFYYAYILSKEKLLKRTYAECSKYALAIFGQAADSVERVKQVIDTLVDANICCTGIHRRIFEVGLPENVTAIADLWLRHGLVQSEAEAVYFQTYEKPMKRKRFMLF